MYDFPEMNYIDVVELFEDRDLADSCGGDALFLAFEPDLFQCEYLIGLFVWVRSQVPRAMYTTP